MRDGGVEIDLVARRRRGAGRRGRHARRPRLRLDAQARAACAPAAPCGWTATSRAVDALALIDDSAGYHARHTAWRWSAGVGTRRGDGGPVAWNLVAGVHDSPTASERTVWVGGTAREVGPVAFADDLGAVAFAEGGALEFTAGATRARHDNLLRLPLRLRAAVRHLPRHAAGRRRAGARATA